MERLERVHKSISSIFRFCESISKEDIVILGFPVLFGLFIAFSIWMMKLLGLLPGLLIMAILLGILCVVADKLDS